MCLLDVLNIARLDDDDDDNDDDEEEEEEKKKKKRVKYCGNSRQMTVTPLIKALTVAVKTAMVSVLRELDRCCVAVLKGV
jgi:hypothetical protein